MAELKQEEPTFPYIPEALIVRLEEMFPLCHPRIEWSERQIWLEIGKRRIVEMLRTQYDKQRSR